MVPDEIRRGVTYAVPNDADPLWCHDRLKGALDQGWVGRIVVTVKLRSEVEFTAALEGVDDLSDEYGTAYFEPPGDRDEAIPLPAPRYWPFAWRAPYRSTTLTNSGGE